MALLPAFLLRLAALSAAPLLLAAGTSSNSDQEVCDPDAQATRGPSTEGVSLIAINSRKLLTLGRTHPTQDSQGRTTCATLDNQGTHSTVNVSVGTPAQVFALVADTGSNSIIIESCICKEMGYCEKENKCFRGTNLSSTFVFDQKHPTEMLITFGSGQIQASKAIDVVSVAGVRANMTDGILLMTDMALDFGGPFEGILGLGPPLKKSEYEDILSQESSHEGTSSGSVEDALRDIIDEVLGGLAGKGSSTSEMEPKKERMLRVGNGSGDMFVPQPKGFLEQANVTRFSMCFNDGDGGVMRLGIAAQPNAHKSVGTEHWGLSLDGITVGNGTSFVQAGISSTIASNTSNKSLAALCTRESMKEGQETPCGIIPDSGTTLIVGPQAHIDALYEALCDGWSRCSENYTALAKAVEVAKQDIEKVYGINPFDFQVSSKAEVMEMLLADCATWLEDTNLDDELPAVHFHVSGDSTNQTITISGNNWVMEMMQEEKKYDYKHFDGFGDVPVGKTSTGKKVKVCSPAFGPMEYDTKINGPVWIMGTPVFYEYLVGYDMENKRISFTSVKEEPCGSCDGKLGLLSSSGRVGISEKKRPRYMPGKARQPSIDVTRPL